MITQITLKHLDLFLELKENNAGQWKLGAEVDKIFDNEVFFKDRVCAENAYTLGWIENGKLLSITTLYQFLPNAAWTWLYYCQIKTKYMNFSKTHGLEIINEMFIEANRRKLSTCYILVKEDFPTITSDAVGNMKKKIYSWHDQVPEIKKYYWVDEDKIPAGTQSQYEYIKWMCNYHAWPTDLRLRMGILKQEFRQDILFS